MFSIVWNFLLIQISANSTGIKAGVNKTVVELTKDELVPLIIENIKTISIPNVHFALNPDILTTNIDITDIKLENLQVQSNDTSIVLEPTSQIELSIQNLSASGYCQYSYYSPNGNGYGSISFKLGNNQSVSKILVSQTNGYPNLQVSDCIQTIDNIELITNGKLDINIQTMINQIFQNQIRTSFENQIRIATRDSISTALNLVLQSLPNFLYLLDTPLALNLEITEDPLVTDNQVQASFNGMTVDINNPNWNPPIPSRLPMPEIDTSHRQVQILVSEYDINSYFYAAHQAGLIWLNISSSYVPSWSPIQLNTTLLNYFMPGLVEKYGANKPVDFICRSESNPVITLNQPSPGYESGSMMGSLLSNCAVDVREQGVAAYLNINLELDAAVLEDNWVLKGQMNQMNVTNVTCHNSTITGDIDTDAIKDVLNYALKLTLPTLNQEFLEKGYPLPQISFIDLTDSQVVVQQGYIDIQATPIFKTSDIVVEPKNYGAKLSGYI